VPEDNFNKDELQVKVDAEASNSTVPMRSSAGCENSHERVKDIATSFTRHYTSDMETHPDFVLRFTPHFLAEMEKMNAEMFTVSDDICMHEIYDQVLALAAGRAKRIRPYVASLLYQDVAKKSDDKIMPALIALEVFHLFALVHDDIMDDADERYGLATIHAHIRLLKEPHLGSAIADHLGRGHAILAGDSLLTRVHDLFHRLASSEVGSSHASQAYKLFLQMSREIVMGQHLDLDLTIREQCTNDDVLRRHHLKTSLYTFVRPMQIGAILGGASEDVLIFCEKFGAAIGQGFQIEDDLLDVLADAQTTGKKTCIDISQRQHTLLTQHVREHGSSTHITLLKKIWGTDMTGDLLTEAREMFQESGAVASVRAKAMQAFSQAEQTLDAAELHPKTKHVLHELVTFFKQRLP